MLKEHVDRWRCGEFTADRSTWLMRTNRTLLSSAEYSWITDRTRSFPYPNHHNTFLKGFIEQRYSTRIRDL